MAGAPDDAVHHVAVFQKQFGQIRAILTCNPSNQRNFVGILHLSQILRPNFFPSSAREIYIIIGFPQSRIWRAPVTGEDAADTAYEVWHDQPSRPNVETACEQVL